MSAPDFYAIQGEAIAECQRLLAETGSSGSVTLTIARLAYEAGARDEREACVAAIDGVSVYNSDERYALGEAIASIRARGGGNG